MNLSRRSIIAIFLLGCAVSACNTSSPSTEVSESQDSLSEIEVSTDAVSSQAVSLGTTYWISNKCNGKRLDIQRNTPAGASPNVQIRNSDNTLGQRWKLVNDASGFLTLQSQGNKQVLSIARALKSDGAAAVTLAKASPTRNEQQWKIYDSNGFSRLVVRHSGKVLQVRGSSSSDGAQVEQGTDRGKCNQRWKFTAVPVTPPTPTPMALRLLYPTDPSGNNKSDPRASTVARNSSVINQLPGNAIFVTVPGTYNLYGAPRENGQDVPCLLYSELPNGDPEDTNPKLDADGNKCVPWPYSKSVWKAFLAPLKTANPAINKRIVVSTQTNDFVANPPLFTDTPRWNKIITNIQNFLGAMKESDPSYIWANDNEQYPYPSDYRLEYYRTNGSSLYPSIPGDQLKSTLTALAKGWGTKIGQAIASNAPNITVLTLHGPYEAVFEFDTTAPTAIALMNNIAGMQLYPESNELHAWVFSGMIEASPNANHVDGGELYELKLGKMKASFDARKDLYANAIGDASRIRLPFAANAAAWNKLQIGFGLDGVASFNPGGPTEFAGKIMEAVRAASPKGIVWAYSDDTEVDNYAPSSPINLALKNAGF
jgi:Ricin-type beta-trefoil lectin domain-like